MSKDSMRQHAEKFIIYKKALGYAYDGPAKILNRYVEYVESASPGLTIPVKTVTDDYLASVSDSAATLFHTVSVLREFSRYLQVQGENAYVIPPKMVSQPVAENPYFFMPEEIEAFFRAVDDIKPHKSFKGRELVIPALFRLLYCCGLRCKEARTLECCNVHLKDVYIDVLQSKGPKSRRIFISTELAHYLESYDVKINILFPGRKYINFR